MGFPGLKGLQGDKVTRVVSITQGLCLRLLSFQLKRNINLFRGNVATANVGCHVLNAVNATTTTSNET